MSTERKSMQNKKIEKLKKTTNQKTNSKNFIRTSEMMDPYC